MCITTAAKDQRCSRRAPKVPEGPNLGNPPHTPPVQPQMRLKTSRIFTCFLTSLIAYLPLGL